jgi:hypothetical protein
MNPAADVSLSISKYLLVVVVIYPIKDPRVAPLRQLEGDAAAAA